jgi:hypothetical protein
VEVDDVIAHAVYDPVARRQRYLKSRRLKGRNPPAAPPPKVGLGSRVVEVGNAASAFHPGAHVNKTAVAQAASNARQVAAIRGRLNDLKSHLKELLAKKKQEATSSSSSDSSKKDTKSSKSEPKTAKQKAAAKEALKKAQQERAKDQKTKPDKQEGGTSLSLDEQITKTRAVITDVETKLRAAIDSARTQTASNGR